MIDALKSTRGMVICGFAVLALAVAALSLATLGGHAAPATVDAAAGTTLGVDATTDGNNTASTLGAIDTCRSVNVGGSFDIDLFVSDVSGLQGWDIYLGFDSSHLTLTAQDTAYMVGGFDASDPTLPDSSGNHFLSAGALAPASGSGVLARLTMHADSSGIANIGISTSPAWPILSGQLGAIGDTNGDGYFDGQLLPARIAIGQDCPGTPVITNSPAPTVTAPPTPTPSPSPTPSPTPTPTATPTQTPAVTQSPTPTPAPTSSEIIVGDGNCSGTVDLPDVLAALTYASHLGPVSACQDRTDTDCDGFVTASDVLRILRFLAGDTLPQPTGCAQIGSHLSG